MLVMMVGMIVMMVTGDVSGGGGGDDNDTSFPAGLDQAGTVYFLISPENYQCSDHTISTTNASGF